MANEPKAQEPAKLSDHIDYMKWLVPMLCIVLVLSTLAILFFVIAVARQIWCGNIPDAGDVSFVAVAAAMFGILITGVFVFMTFRIDRGAILEAHETAKKEADRVLTEARDILNDVKNQAKNAASESIAKDKEQIREDAMAHTQTEIEKLETKLTEAAKKAKDDSEDFAVKIVNKLKNRTIVRLRAIRCDPQDANLDIPDLNREDGKSR